jgi:hypothetical protein
MTLPDFSGADDVAVERKLMVPGRTAKVSFWVGI